tara:strand:+ start:1952 stop:2101 length:150 start_codon:yes stop_codon:yes gene_type:complete
MKECCKGSCDKKTKKTGLRKWLNYLLYTVITIIVLGALLLQLLGKKPGV